MVDLTDVIAKKKPNIGRRIGGLLGLVLVIFVLVAAIIWLNRGDIGQYYLGKWCSDRGVTCEARFTELNFRNVSLEEIIVESQGVNVIEGERLHLALDWPGFLSPQLGQISVTRPVIRAVIADGKPGLYGLEDILSDLSGDGSTADTPAKLPELDIQDGLINLSTDAGEITGQFRFQGIPLQDGRALLEVRPSVLRQGDAEVGWSAGDVDLVFVDGIIRGDIDFTLEQVLLDQLTLGPTKLTGRFSAEDGQTSFDLTGDAGAFVSHILDWEEISFLAKGESDQFEDFSGEAVLNALKNVILTAQGKGLILKQTDSQIGTAALSLEMDRKSGALSGPLALEVKGAANKAASAERVVLVGDITVPEQTRASYHYKGTIGVHGASLAPALKSTLFEAIKAQDPLAAHARQLRLSLSQAVSKFDIGIDLDADYNEEGWSIEARRPSLMDAASGLMFSITPFNHQAWLRASPDEIELSGDISLSGGQGTPRVSGAVQTLRIARQEADLQLRSISLKPWSAEGQTISARLDSLILSSGASQSIDANGAFSFSGEIAGVALEETRLSGHVLAAQGGEVWRVQTYQNSCVGFSTAGLASGALAFDPAVISLCPVDGRFVRQENDQSVGRIHLGDISAPFHIGDSGGVFDIEDANVEWAISDGLDLVFRGRALSLPLTFGTETLTISGLAPEVLFGAHGGPVELKAQLGRTQFGGSMVPANVVSDAFTFDGRTSEAGVDGDMRARHVRISDINSPAIYEPLVGEFTAMMRAGLVHMKGPIRLESKNVVIANALMNLDLVAFSGDAHVTIEPISFAVGALQPTDLSEMLRGVLTNALGGVTGRADFLIREGALSGTGYVDLVDIIFDTFTVGRVSGVTGRVHFSDILGLTTPKSQEVRIDFMDPGVPLNDGVIRFQIIEAETTKLEGAVWPFAGGELLLSPTEFKSGGALDEGVTVTVEAKALQLEGLIDVLKVPDLRATGTVSGMFPIDIEGANIMVRNAILEADKEGGKLSYTGTAADIAKGQNEYADHALEALKDLDYSVMRVGANGNLIGQIIVTADLLGKSEDVLGGAEFDFGLSVDSNLSQLLRSASNASSKTYLSDAKTLQDARQKEAEE